MFSSVQDGTFEIGNVHMRSTLLSEVLPNVAFETVPMLNPFKLLTKWQFSTKRMKIFSSIVLFYTDVDLPFKLF